MAVVGRWPLCGCVQVVLEVRLFLYSKLAFIQCILDDISVYRLLITFDFELTPK